MPTLPAQGDLTYFLDRARSLSDGVAPILLQGFGTASASRKLDGSLVTQVDQAVDQYITDELKRAFPDHAILSEELHTAYDAHAEFTWVIDPLDGTTNFARGLPIWGVSIALLYFGLPIIGLLDFISLHERYSAIAGNGSTLNNNPIRTAEERALDDQHFLMLCTRTPRRYNIDVPLKPRILGSAAYHIASVANGSALAAIEATPKVWDIAAALLILTEAGGCYRTLEGPKEIFPLNAETSQYESISFPLLAAANKSIMSELEPKIARRTQ
jgi:myo-inositol-1(or 4)-monophosphatase